MQLYPVIYPSLNLDFANAKGFLDPRVTFTRASTGTYYDGKTKVLAEQNLLTYSEQFDNSIWSKYNTTVTANTTTAPDGTTTADSLIENTTNVIHSLDSSPFSTAGNFTSSIYLKANGRNFVRLYVSQISPNVNYTALFDLSLGTIVSTDAGVTSTITSVGNGWYRCTVSALTVGTQVRITVGLQNATGSIVAYTGDGVSGCYLWGAQLEQRSASTAYNPTTTSTITNYISQLLTAPINAPRFDYNPVTGESLGLLIEQSSTNLLLQSGSIGTSPWATGASTINTSVAIAPDGTQSASWLIYSSGGARIVQAYTATSTSNIFSVYVKSTGLSGNWASSGASLLFYNSTTSTALGNVPFSGATFTAGGANATSTYVGNGWYRISLYQSTGISVGNTVIAYLYCDSANGSSGSLYCWGGQAESLAFPTSYIPTTSAQVTRAADTANMTGTNFSSWYNQNQGTFFADYIANQSLPTTFSAGIFGCGPGGYASTNSSQLFLGSNQIVGYYQPNGYPEIGLYANVKPLIGKIAMSYSLTLGTLVVNNSTVITQSGNFPNNGGINSIQLGTRDYNSNTNYLNGWIKKFAYYPQQITASQSQSLTGS